MMQGGTNSSHCRPGTQAIRVHAFRDGNYIIVMSSLLNHSFASATPPAVSAKLASFSGMSGLKQHTRRGEETGADQRHRT